MASINLEWYRTFKAVYKHRNYSKAAEELFMTQPTVSNQMNMLEAAIGHKLFNRKSKGVEPTENAKFLNNLVIEALDSLEIAEASYSKSVSKAERIYTLGISPHMYKGLLGDKDLSVFKHLTVHFELDNQKLFDLVNNQELDAAIVRGKMQTYDTLTHKIGGSRLVVVAHPDINTQPFQAFHASGDVRKMQQWLERQTWFSHMTTNPYIKLFWLHCLGKQRPKVFTNYVIPNEQFMLEELVKTPGIAIALKSNVQPFLDNGSLQLLWENEDYPERAYYLMTHKKQRELFELMLDQLI